MAHPDPIGLIRKGLDLICTQHIGPAESSLVVVTLEIGGHYHERMDYYAERVEYAGNRRFKMRGNENASISEVVNYFQLQAPIIVEVGLEQQRPREESGRYQLFKASSPELTPDIYYTPSIVRNLHMQPPGQLRRVSNNSRPPNSVPYRGGGRNYFNALSNFNRARANR